MGPYDSDLVPPLSEGSIDNKGVAVTTKISEDAARIMDGEGKGTVRNIQQDMGCTSIEFKKYWRGTKKKRITIRAPNMDVATHAMRLIEEKPEKCTVGVGRLRKSRCELEEESGRSPTTDV